LIVLPGHPEHGPFYIVKGLLKVLNDYPFEVGHGGRSMCLLSILPALASLYQTELPYHINKGTEGTKY